MVEPKTIRLSVKVLPAHKAALTQLAQNDDTSAAAIMRRLIRAEAQRRGLWPHTTQQTQQAEGVRA